MAKYALMIECLEQFNQMPWGPAVEVKHQLGQHLTFFASKTISDSLSWVSHLFDSTMPFRSDGDPRDGRFKYTSGKPRSKETVEQMIKAEENLKAFWAKVDSHVTECTGAPYHGVLAISIEMGQFVRQHRWTEPWTEPTETTLQETRDAPVKHRFKTEEQLGFLHAHNETKQITGRFERLTVKDKAKIKTRGKTTSTPDNNTATAKAEEVQEKPQHRYNVKRDVYQVITALFYIRDEIKPLGCLDGTTSAMP